jgi:hypothetical protein
MWFCKFFRRHKRRLKLTAHIPGFTFTGRKMNTQLDDTQKFTLTVVEQNAAGGTVPFGGVPAWTSADDAVATVVAASDGASAVVSSVAVGATTVAVTVDGLRAEWLVGVVAAPGVQLVLTASAPEPK